MLRRLLSTHTRILFQLKLTNSQTRTVVQAQQQPYSSSIKKADLDKEIERMTDLATIAKDEMDFAEESRNSVYYNEDKQAAHKAVDEMTIAYNELLQRLSAEDKKAIETRIGMRIKEIQNAYEIMTLNDLEE
ncbi:hypothetical protein J3B02_006295 [Coemansia erecta]|uniref:Uncharacterized protein n=1 Tax=Coemansia asiatica TaxID=1052880 RepID=A0A9W7XRQ0_9FUNG|nr:hypothetical protein LPJ64_000032 [Coemansia asiatica]KAJ2839615.1 hypothetical protein J3B02_006295 [Coemansia erecta]